MGDLPLTVSLDARKQGHAILHGGEVYLADDAQLGLVKPSHQTLRQTLRYTACQAMQDLQREH